MISANIRTYLRFLLAFLDAPYSPSQFVYAFPRRNSSVILCKEVCSNSAHERQPHATSGTLNYTLKFSNKAQGSMTRLWHEIIFLDQLGDRCYWLNWIVCTGDTSNLAVSLSHECWDRYSRMWGSLSSDIDQAPGFLGIQAQPILSKCPWTQK